MTDGTESDKKFKLVAMTITEIATRNSDGLKVENDGVVSMGKDFDDRVAVDSEMAEQLGVSVDRIHRKEVEDDETVTFVGHYSNANSVGDDMGDSRVITKTITIMTKKVPPDNGQG